MGFWAQLTGRKPRCGKRLNAHVPLQCKLRKAHEPPCRDGVCEFNEDAAWLCAGPTDPGGDLFWDRNETVAEAPDPER